MSLFIITVFDLVFEFSERDCLPLLAWEVFWQDRFSDQGNNKFGSQHFKNTLPWHLISIGMVQCVLPASLYNSWTARNMPLWTWEFSPMVKAIFSTCGSSIIAASTCLKTTLLHFSLYSTNSFGKVFEFNERSRLLATSCWSHLTVQFHLISVTTAMAVNTQRTQNILPWTPFSWSGTVSYMCFTKLFTMQGNMVFLNPGPGV